MRTLCLILFVLVLHHTTAAQTSSSAANKRHVVSEEYYESTLNGKVNIGSLGDPNSPTIQPGFEWRFNRKLAVEFAYGIPIAVISKEKRRTDTTYHRYYKVRASLRFFPNGKAFYIGPEFSMVKKEQSKWNDEIVLKADSKVYDYTYAEFEKSAVTFGIKAGSVIGMTKKLTLDISMTTGIRCANLDVNATGLTRRDVRPLIFPNFSRDREGRRVTGHVAFGFALSYVLF